MASTVVNFRLDEETKREMEEVCEGIGISMSAAFTIFAKAMVREEGFPFEVSTRPRTRYEVVPIDPEK